MMNRVLSDVIRREDEAAGRFKTPWYAQDALELRPLGQGVSHKPSERSSLESLHEGDQNAKPQATSGTTSTTGTPPHAFRPPTTFRLI